MAMGPSAPLLQGRDTCRSHTPSGAVVRLRKLHTFEDAWDAGRCRIWMETLRSTFAARWRS
jgi:hypothetical protein